jgi:hypothetical protein
VGGSIIEQQLRYGKVDAGQTGIVAGLSVLPFGIAKLLPNSVKQAISKFGSSFGKTVGGFFKCVGSKFKNIACRETSVDAEGLAKALAAREVAESTVNVRTLYHYTNEKGMKGILESEQLNPS